MRHPAIVAMALVWLGAACHAPQGEGSLVRVTVPSGATMTAAAESLVAHDVVADAGLFRFYAHVTGRERALRAGTFELPRHAAYLDAVQALTTGSAIAYERLVVPEGLMLQEVAKLVQEQLNIPADSVIAAAEDTALLHALDVPAATVEGYLYPSTYYVPAGASARDVVRQMVTEFQHRWQPEWTARAASLGLTRHQVVTLASIIEGEVRYPRDRPYVSSVYHNRLRAGMRLQADPTVIYALRRRRRLFERDYQTPSPYNTYLHDGLPPGPIDQPSVASIQAALYPAHTDFLYLVADSSGQHVFSRTLREHRRAVAQVRDEH